MSDISLADRHRVVHLAQSDCEGGANMAAFRLHKALCDLGVDSFFHAGRKLGSDPTVIPAAPAPFSRLASTTAAYLNARALRAYPRRKGPFSPVRLSYGRLKQSLIDSADVVCLHWIAGAFLRPANLATIGRPQIWRLSDLWPFTGGCHFPADCHGFENACGNCPILDSVETDDLSRAGYRARERAYPALDLTVVAPSRWIADQARRSSLFHGRRIEHIPTGVDLSVFRPHDRAEARAELGLPGDDRVILFGAFAALDDPRKGYGDLKSALRLLATGDKLENTILAVFGGRSGAAAADLPLPSLHLGSIGSESQLAKLYAAADVLVAPSREDNLPNVVLEALACGTPVVAFDAGGIRDAVEHQTTGFLADPGASDALARGIDSVLDQVAVDGCMRHAARAGAVARFDLQQCASRYRALFEELSEQRRADLDKIAPKRSAMEPIP